MSIEIKNISFTYMKGTAFERKALNEVSLTIPEGKFIAIAGHTGSGKSTLVQHFNGLISPDEGSVLVDGIDINKKGEASLSARHRVGMVFQYPESQLFDETVYDDIAFGPKNLGIEGEALEQCIKKSMELVQLDFDKYKGKSPFQLSGGQMRRVAIAGVLAMNPKYLVLDEPTAGLDPRSREAILKKFDELNKKNGTTIILISHNMEDIARLADEVIVMDSGKVLATGAPEDIFMKDDILEKAGLEAPAMVSLLKELREQGLDVDPVVFTMNKGIENILEALKKKQNKSMGGNV